MTAYRLDTVRLLELVDGRLAELRWSRRRLATVLGTTSGAFSRMVHGGAPDSNLLLSLLIWLDWAPELALLAVGDGEMLPACGTCFGSPPAGFSCVYCGAVGVRP